MVSLHPGAVKNDFLRVDENALFSSRVLNLFARLTLPLIGISTVEGAITSIHCATANDLVNGAYYEYLLSLN